MIDYFDYVTLRTKESDPWWDSYSIYDQVEFGKTPKQIVEHVNSGNYEEEQRFCYPVFFGQINIEH